MPRALNAQDYDVIFHIGAPKTGTSAIQAFLLKSTKLLKKYGFYYPDHGGDENNISGGHVQLGVPLIDKKIEEAEQQLQSWLIEAKAQSLCLLISGESLYGKFKELKQITNNYRVGIIAYFRHPIELIISNHNQIVKRHFGTQTLHQYTQKFLTSSHPNPGISGEIFNNWQSNFGSENFILTPYNKDIYPNNRIEASFLSLLSIKAKNRGKFQYFQKNINNSYTREALELKRLINHVLNKKEHQFNFQIDWKLQAYSDQNSTHAKIHPALLLGNALYQQLNEHFQDQIDIIYQTFFKDFPNALSINQSIDTKNLNLTNKYNLSWVANQAFCNDPELIKTLKKKINQSIQHKKNLNYDLIKLAEIFDINIDQYKFSTQIFTNEKINYFISPKTKLPDILRDISALLEQNGHFEQAYKLIGRALELRPKGPAIIDTHKRLTAQLNESNHTTNCITIL